MRLVLALLLVAASASAQPSAGSRLDSLAAAAAAGTARFADRRAAAADGYRRLGPDFPGMGEHWLHPGVLLSGRIDAERPTILIYATIAGTPRLLGVGFVTTTRQGERGDPDVPGWPSAWHEHSGLLHDESGVSPGTRAPSGTHVWVLHAWTVLANPDGRFTPDNWSLPFLRANLAPPAVADPDAARALALLFDGDRYLRGLLTDGGLVAPENAGAVDSIIVRAREAVSTVTTGANGGAALTSAQMDGLRSAWHTLSVALRARLGGGVDPFLAVPHRHHP